MGGGSYDSEVAETARTIIREQNLEAFTYRGVSAGRVGRGVHPLLDPSGKVRECVNETPIVVALDVTRSRGQDSKIVFDRLPKLLKQLQVHAYVPDPAISFVAVGDATAEDKAPLQVGQFEADNRLDSVLTNFWLEEGGGGTGRESYELLAFYFARRTRLHCLERAKKGFFFFLGDEAPYDEVNRQQVKAVLGHEISENVPTEQIFRELQQRFHVFLIFPQKPMSERQSDIDAEIKQRVLKAGGRYEGVDIRASLMWNNRNDLDLHVITPRGEHIYYGMKRASCSGFLDVDMNVQGETTKPVENVQWITGSAPTGRYRVFVQNYRFHEHDRAPTPFHAEIEINGEIQKFDGIISPKGETGASSDITLIEFDYNPAKRVHKGNGTPYAEYTDEVILGRWGQLLPQSHIIRIRDPHDIPEVIGGVLAVTEGGQSPSHFVQNQNMGTGDSSAIQRALEPLARAWVG